MALTSGRDITASEETTRTPVALVNQTMAKQSWPTEDPIGRRFRVVGDETPDWFTVVGVVADFRHGQAPGNRPVFPSAYVRTRSHPRSIPVWSCASPAILRASRQRCASRFGCRTRRSPCSR